MKTNQSISKAESRLLELGIADPSEIDVEAIAWDEGIKVQYSDLSGCEARLVGFGDRGIVTLRNSSDERRKRFSLAHELGHWNYHRGRSFSCRVDEMIDGFSTKPVVEREADEYAANLLMPAYMLKPLALKIKRPTFDGIDDLARQFRTSRTATAIRLVELNVWPLLLVCHSVQGRVWFRRSKDVPEKWFPQKKLDEDSIAFDRLFANQDRIRAQKIGADAWFDQDDADQFDILEDAVRISNSQVLTLLWLESDVMLEARGR